MLRELDVECWFHEMPPRRFAVYREVLGLQVWFTHLTPVFIGSFYCLYTMYTM